MQPTEHSHPGPKHIRPRHPVKPLTAFRYRLFPLLAVIGPGFITANVDNDPGGILTYSQAGAKYGYRSSDLISVQSMDTRCFGR